MRLLYASNKCAMYAGISSGIDRSGNLCLARKRARRIVVLSIIGALLAAGVGMAYRAFMAPWRGDVREPLITALFVGVAYFVGGLLWLRRTERREQLNRQDQKG